MREKQQPPPQQPQPRSGRSGAALVNLPPPPPLPNREMLLQPPPGGGRPPPAPSGARGILNSYFREEQSRRPQQQRPPTASSAASTWRYSGADKQSAEGEGQLSSGGELDEEEDDDEEEESTLKDRGVASCSSNRRPDKSARHAHHHHQHQQQHYPASDDETDEELSSSAELSSSSSRGGAPRRRHFVPSAPRPAHATRASATEDLTTTGCEEDFQWLQHQQQQHALRHHQEQNLMMQESVNSLHDSNMQDSMHSSVSMQESVHSMNSSHGSQKGASRRESGESGGHHHENGGGSATGRSRGEVRHRSKRHLKSTQEKISSLERARHRMKSAPPGECYENEHNSSMACCPFEEHLHHMCRASLTMPSPAHHRYSYHGPCGCSTAHLADPPPPYDYFRWRYFMKSPIGDVEERMQRLENEKDSLRLQVSVLSEQVEAQSEKMADLERQLCEKKRELSKAQEMLQLEMLSRSSLETQKLELMANVADMKRRQALMERQHLEIQERAQRSEAELSNMLMQVSEERRRLREKPPVAPKPMGPMLVSSTPYNSMTSGESPSKFSRGTSPSPSLGSSIHNSIASPLRRSASATAETSLDDHPPPPKTPPSSARFRVDQQQQHCGTMPRTRDAAGLSSPDLDAFRPSQRKTTTVAFGKSFMSFRTTSSTVTNSRSSSAPNLAETEKDGMDARDGAASPQLSINQQKPKGIKKIFGRLKRSGSGSLDELVAGDGNEFQRGGVRATTGGRLGWSRDLTSEFPQRSVVPDLPLCEWDTDTVCGWLLEMGLEAYVPEARRFVKDGKHLAACTNHDLDKELGIKNTFHRKKLQLSIAAIGSSNPSPPDIQLLSKAASLDGAWVLRWLDDIGLPQHKDAFLAARIDGAVLHRLTTEDLVALHITSCLQAASFKRGIQVLRENEFNPNCLIRRSSPEDQGVSTVLEVSLWTNHRVMEWLRAVDLAEYAPNMRGSGVHGALMVHEPKFTAELLASLLAIPPNKTLLRRHLSTHFQELVGRDKISEKRQIEAQPGFVPLTATSKLKPSKKSQFTLKKKKIRAEMELDDLVCPLDSESRPGSSKGSRGRSCLSGGEHE
ncbi:liprin-beta-1 isoform X4 [Neocloeon triangulifer]|uniref:liprin-beta-1 isoform X4 n=1 Tax=Neocloeon triangulifer TaxID=2078957 RepID=UPI00286F27DC|nr:liprin-beta-1 isoform X4 [Neocloeon triangulifer]